MENNITLSALGHTWILDLDGTLLKHNGYLLYGEDEFLDGAENFLKSIPLKDMIIFLTSRKEEYRTITEEFLVNHQIRYDCIIFNVPFGERILINDSKASGLQMCKCIPTVRDKWCCLKVTEDERL